MKKHEGLMKITQEKKEGSELNERMQAASLGRLGKWMSYSVSLAAYTFKKRPRRKF